METLESSGLDVVFLRSGRYAVRPAGKLGTCGWHNSGKPWTIAYISAGSKLDALRKYRRKYGGK